MKEGFARLPGCRDNASPDESEGNVRLVHRRGIQRNDKVGGDCEGY